MFLISSSDILICLPILSITYIFIFINYFRSCTNSPHNFFHIYSNSPLPSDAYWHTLEYVLTQYVRHSDNKFDYDHEGIAQRKHIVINKIRYIGKESNNLEDNLSGLDDPDYLEYDNIEDFKQWILSLKPKDVRDKGISKQTLWNIKKRIRKNEMKYKSKTLKGIYKVYQERKLNN